jgi:hypothetical protein
MTMCYKCSISDGRKQWYTFAVDVRKISYLDRPSVKGGKLTRMLCKDCASKLSATRTTNLYKSLSEK